MEAINFQEQNLVLRKPDSMTDEECGSLPVFYDGEQFVSCWQPTPEDLAILAAGGKIWLGMLSKGHPPVYMTTRSPFTRPPTLQQD